MKYFIAALLAIFSLSSHAQFTKLKEELQEHHAGVSARQINKKVFLEGSVDRPIERKYIEELCNSYISTVACVSFIRLRAPAPVLAPPVLRIEYSVLYVPKAPLLAGGLLKMSFYNADSLPTGSSLLKSIAVNLIDDFERSPASDSTEALPAKSVTTSETSAGAQKQMVLLDSKSSAGSVPGTDKIVLNTQLSLRGIAGIWKGEEKTLESSVVLMNGEKTALAAWVLNQNAEGQPALIVYVKAEKLRNATE